MYQKASDLKSHLMLSLLSWVNHLHPKFCYFENVRGFLQYNLNAVQANRYRVKGGIPVGGLKFLERALITMGYVHLAKLELLCMLIRTQIPDALRDLTSCALWRTAKPDSVFPHCCSDGSVPT